MAIPQQTQPIAFRIKAPPELDAAVRGTITSMFRSVDFSRGRLIEVSSQDTKAGILTTVKLEGHNPWQNFDSEINRPCYNRHDRKNRVKERVRLGVRTVLGQVFGLSLGPWGILTGVRPTKLVHRLLDRNFSREQIHNLLTDVYCVSEERQQLLFDVVEKQRSFFLPNVNNPVSVYVGIPFCPTRCGYCSFAAYPLQTHGHLVEDFLSALELEIKSVGELLRSQGIRVQSVYLGGGTPTTIKGRALSNLLQLLNQYFDAESCQEYTVEAGRPETLDVDTIAIMKEHGVQRLSINPQTMHDRTLKLIGREHTADQVRRAFELAHSYNFAIINSDLILGLPGENLEDFAESLDQVIKLNPDNITIHSLALKRASHFGKTAAQLELEHELGEQMAELAQKSLEEAGMHPYYLYRQRFILSDLENIGYAKPGAESIYNIQMMEERQTIIGLGGGAITKLVSPDLAVVRHANPKCPATYAHQVCQLIDAKKYQIKQHLSV